MVNQKTQNVQWDFTKRYNHVDNVAVTNNVIDFVSTQVQAKTNQHWTCLISHHELSSKISSVFRRQKGKNSMPDARKAEIKKKNVRKTRRITVSLIHK